MKDPQSSEPLARRFGRQVRVMRTRLGFTQQELGRRAGMHPAYVGGVERGERNITLEGVERLARALGVPAAELMGDSPPSLGVTLGVTPGATPGGAPAGTAGTAAATTAGTVPGRTVHSTADGTAGPSADLPVSLEHRLRQLVRQAADPQDLALCLEVAEIVLRRLSEQRLSQGPSGQRGQPLWAVAEGPVTKEPGGETPGETGEAPGDTSEGIPRGRRRSRGPQDPRGQGPRG